VKASAIGRSAITLRAVPAAGLAYGRFHEDDEAPGQQHAPADQRLHTKTEDEASYEQNEGQDCNRETKIGQKHAEKLMGDIP